MQCGMQDEGQNTTASGNASGTVLSSEGQLMKSLNFEFLRPQHAELADLAGFAEHYLFSDPESALVKLRTFAEFLVTSLYHQHRLDRGDARTQLDLLSQENFRAVTPKVVVDKLHLLRQRGNNAAHGSLDGDGTSLVQSLLMDTHDIARWMYINLSKAKLTDIPAFQMPTPEQLDTKGALKRAKRDALQKLTTQEARMSSLLLELEQVRAKAKAAEKSKEELASILAQGQNAADVLKFDEATTRDQLIDEQLVQAGWDVGHKGANTEEVTQEHPVQGLPTDSGKGKCDYVLWNDNGTPLAVIEAKRTSEDSVKGQQQAKQYADALQEKHKVRPVIFYTNGGEIHLWDDSRKEPPRRIFGFYSKESLQYNHAQRAMRQEPLDQLNPSDKIINRGLYQIEAVKRVTEQFQQRHRKALIIQATGTGKTRVAISLCELMIRAGWAKRILFLCDRRELRKQARDAFQEHLPGEPAIYVTGKTSDDTTQRIYLGTYPAMLKCYEKFDVGFFDLIIADESHRSIYNRYRSIFTYFDAFQLGLTATPLKFVERNTYRIFECPDKDPTSNFSYIDAITHNPPFLCPFRVVTVTTKFLREGIEFEKFTDDQKRETYEQGYDSESIDYTREQVSRKVFSRDTDRLIIRNLMEHGIRNADGTRLGKTIVFARNHQHAKILVEEFNALFPQYGGEFCRRIDNYEPKAEQLISDFKSTDGTKDLTIAVSVDMLDTGIDVPSVVNLVFAKPVKSYAKFWQMIGRGTRLCRNLFGPGQDKTEFLIFDHWGNFEYFDEDRNEAEPTRSKSLTEKLFEARLQLAETAHEKQSLPAFEGATQLIIADVASLPDRSIPVKEKWREVKTVQQDGIIEAFHPSTLISLRQDIAPLMQWRARDIRESALELDLLMAKLEAATISGAANQEDLRQELIQEVQKLPINLKPVQDKISTIDRVKTTTFWEAPSFEDLEAVRKDLRGIMRFRPKTTYAKPEPIILDITEEGHEVVREVHHPTFEGLDLVAYRHRVNAVLEALFDTHPVLQKVKRGQAVKQGEFEPLAEAVLLQDPSLSLEELTQHFPSKSRSLALAIRRVIGLDPEFVDASFQEFVQSHPALNPHQIRFLDLLKGHIATYGAIEIETLYEAPFTQIHSDGIDGVFPEDADQLVDLIQKLNGDDDTPPSSSYPARS